MLNHIPAAEWVGLNVGPGGASRHPALFLGQQGELLAVLDIWGRLPSSISWHLKPALLMLIVNRVLHRKVYVGSVRLEYCMTVFGKWLVSDLYGPAKPVFSLRRQSARLWLGIMQWENLFLLHAFIAGYSINTWIMMDHWLSIKDNSRWFGS